VESGIEIAVDEDRVRSFGSSLMVKMRGCVVSVRDRGPTAKVRSDRAAQFQRSLEVLRSHALVCQ